MSIVQKEYEKDEKLKKEDVRMLKEWCDNQPHLPKMTEQEVIWFLHSCYFSNEIAKVSIDNYFTIKTMSPEIFKKRENTSEIFQENLKSSCITIMPKKTHEGHTVCFLKLWSSNAEHFNVNEFMKIVDMVVLLDIYLNGTHEGLRFCMDVKNITFGHVAKLNILSLKKFFLYLQEAMPVRLRGIHYFNANSAMDRVLTMIKPFLKKEILEVLTVHKTSEEVYNYVPLECLPSDYGGTCDSTTSLHEQSLKTLAEHENFFEHQDEQLVNESRRPGKPKDVSDMFGVEGTFKKLDLF